MGDALQQAWERRLMLMAEGDKLYAEGDALCAKGEKLKAEAIKLWAERLTVGPGGVKPLAEGFKLRAKGDKLYAEGDVLCAEGVKLDAEARKLGAMGNNLWAEAVLAVHGNIALKWKWNDAAQDNDCLLPPGEHFVARAAAQEGE